jgi:hypothetical protein
MNELGRQISSDRRQIELAALPTCQIVGKTFRYTSLLPDRVLRIAYCVIAG